MSVHVEAAELGAELAIGRLLDGRFTILEKLGEGGMGAVYRAHQRSVDREVAIKVVRLDLVEHPEAIKLFLREAKLTSKLNHPNAVGVLDFGQTEDGVFYLAMELVKGRTLDQVLRDEGPMASARVVRIGMQICDALETAHAMQIVHRDLKPANIMLVDRIAPLRDAARPREAGTFDSRRDFVKVLDFGLAKAVVDGHDVMFSDHELRQIPADQLQATTLHGTPAFLPPERSTGGVYDARSDLYSLGCVLYLLASGELPFTAVNAKELVAMHSTSRPAPLLGVTLTIAAVIEKLLSKAPDERYQSAAETRDALEEAAAIDGVPSYQSSPNLEQARLSGRISTPMWRVSQPIETQPMPAPEPPPTKQRAALFVGLGAVLALGIAIVVVSTNRSESSEPVKPPPVSEQAPPAPVIKPEVKSEIKSEVEKPAGAPEAKVVEAKPQTVKKKLPHGGKPPVVQVPQPPTKPPASKPQLPF